MRNRAAFLIAAPFLLLLVLTAGAGAQCGTTQTSAGNIALGNTISGDTTCVVTLGQVIATMPPITNGLLAYYPANEGTGTILHDLTANANNGSFGGTGNTWSTTGVVLNGSGWVSLPAALNSALTIQTFVSTQTPTSGYETIVGGNALVTNSFIWALNISPAMLAFVNGFGDLNATPFAGSGTVAVTLAASGSDEYYVNGKQTYFINNQSNTLAGTQTAGNYQLGSSIPASIGNMVGTFGPTAFYSRVLAPWEIAQNAAYFNQLELSRTGVTPAVANVVTNNQFVAMGDSDTFGLGSGSVPYCNWVAFTATYTTQCFGFTGTQTNSALGDIAQLTNYATGTLNQYNIFFIYLGVNDLANSVPNTTIINNLFAACRAVEQVNPTAVVLLGTIQSSTGQDTNKDIINPLLRRAQSGSPGAGNPCSGVVDIAADPVFGADGAYANTTYYTGGLHFTVAGQQEFAGILTRYVNSLSGATLASPTLVSANSYVMTTNDNFLVMTPTAASTVTLPECIGLTGQRYTITNNSAGNNLLQVSGLGAETITGLSAISQTATVAFLDVAKPPSTAGCYWQSQLSSVVNVGTF